MAVIAFQPGPGAEVLALRCDDTDEFDRLWADAEAGRLTFDGQPVKCITYNASDRQTLFIRFRLARPYLPPPLVLRFEDVQTAVRIAETGFYSFEGALHRARHRGGGEVVLDRIFHQPPPPVWHGRMLHDPPATAAVDVEAAAE